MASITIKNTVDNIKLARAIKQVNQEAMSAITVEFSEDNTEISMIGEVIYLPSYTQVDDVNVTFLGEVIEIENNHFCIVDEIRAKTVNVHLDSRLVAEINAIREYVRTNINKEKTDMPENENHDTTQHDILLKVLRRGIDQLKKDFGM